MEVLLIGVVGKAHGLRGEVAVHPHNTASPLWAQGVVLYGWKATSPTQLTAPPERPTVTLPASARQFVIQKARRVPGSHVVVSFEEVNTRNLAEEIRGFELAVAPGVLPEAESDEVYHHEVVGWSVVHIDGRSLGTVKGIMTLPAQDVIEMTTPAGKAALVPFVSAIVVRIERAARTLVLDPPQGLIPGDGDEADEDEDEETPA